MTQAQRIAGIREDLPPGEHVLWQGSPVWTSMARHVFHVREVAFYFLLLSAYSTFSALREGAFPRAAIVLVALGMAACGILALLGCLSARTTIYAITTRRVFLRIGIALPSNANLPLHRIEAASLGLHGDGTGDLPMLLEPSAHLAYLHLWPHARPWHLRRPEPSMRCVADPQRVAAILSEALLAATPARAPQPGAGRDDGREVLEVGGAPTRRPAEALA